MVCFRLCVMSQGGMSECAWAHDDDMQKAPNWCFGGDGGMMMNG